MRDPSCFAEAPNVRSRDAGDDWGRPGGDAKALVRDAVARHLDVDRGGIKMAHHLSDDLQLDPLDLVLIALRIEEREGAEFPIETLEGAQTVSDLVRAVRAMRGKKRNPRRAA